MADQQISKQNVTVDKLRDDIDRGRAGDKVDGPDPAAVPLGADEEAAGTPLSPDLIRQTRDVELSRLHQPPQHRHGPGHAWILICIVLILAIGVIGLGIFLS